MADIHPQRSDYTSTYRKADDVLLAWTTRRNKILEILLDNPLTFVKTLWSDPKMISVNNGCMCEAGNSKAQAPFNRYFKCNECTLLGRLVDLSDEYVEESFIIECGMETGRELTIKSDDMISVLTAITLRHKKYLEEIISKTNYLTCDSLENDNTIYIGSDKFTNNMLINWVIEDIFNQCSIDNYLKLYNFYLCNNVGYSIYEYSSIGNIKELYEYNKFNVNNKFTDKTIHSILIQLIMVFKLLRSYSFIHGSPNINSLEFSNKPCSYVYKDVNVTGPVTLKLIDFKNSGITIKRNANEDITFVHEGFDKVISKNSPVRLYSRSVLSEEQFTFGGDSVLDNVKLPHRPNIETMKLNRYHCDDDNRDRDIVNMYSFSNSTKFLRFLRHSGLPLYANSFDIVSFMVSLMSYGPFYRGVVSNIDLYNLWKGLWKPTDLVAIEKRLTTLHNAGHALTSTSDITKLLTGKWIRCDALDYLWKHVSKVDINIKIHSPR